MTTPLEFDGLDKASDFDADSGRENSSQQNSANIACINVRRSISGLCAALIACSLAGVPKEAEALPPFEPIRNDSGLIDIGSLQKSIPDVSELSKTSWEEIKGRLDTMDTSDILDFMGSIAEVVEDFKKTFRSDLHKKLLDSDLQAAQPDSKVLEEDEKQFLLEIVQKYGVGDINLFISILNKQNYSERDCKFLFLAFRQVVSAQRNSLSIYLKMRGWVVSNRADDSSDSRVRYLNNPEALSYFMQMETLMARFEKGLISR